MLDRSAFAISGPPAREAQTECGVSVFPLNAPASACASPRAKPYRSPGRVVADTSGSAITSKVMALAFGKGADRAVLGPEAVAVLGLLLGRGAEIAEGRLGDRLLRLDPFRGLEACDTPRSDRWALARFLGQSITLTTT